MSSYWKKFGFALKGIRWAISTQINLRIQLIIAAMVLIAGYFFSISRLEWLLIVACISIVLAAELINSAIEAFVDFASPEWNEKAGKVKDVSAGAVLILAIGSAIVGLIIFLPKIIRTLLG